MLAIRRRRQSIDHKLPLLASGLVLLTVVVLGWTAYAQLERALVDSAGRRLFGAAKVVAQMVQRPSQRPMDSATVAAEKALRAFVRGKGGGSRDAALAALAALARPQSARDTSKVYAALVDSAGRTLLAYHRRSAAAPRWPTAAIARGEIRGDALTLGPFESVAGVPTISVVRSLRDSSAGTTALRGYLVESRAISSGRVARQFGSIIGPNVEVLIGQPGAGVWTDLERIAAAPPARVASDTIVAYDGGVGAAARVAGTNWIVWLSQPMDILLAPARAFLWSMVPLGLIIALVGAAVMWRMARRITHPIVQLTAAAESVAIDGGATSMVPTVWMTQDADEVTRLRYAFERMADRVAERHALDQQLRHAQKMEAVGRLAGGVAHDFNNLLTAIRSYADLMLDDMPAWDAKRSDVQEIRAAATRAAALTAQLLAFSRKQMLQPRVLDTQLVLTDVQAMLRRLVAEDIELEVHAPAGLWPVKADRGQLEQVIVNLAVNARDAMPHGGALRIAARNEPLEEGIESKHGVVPPGEYVAIRVTDTGLGMDTPTQYRVFEPFFTTKAVGQGTGLGLATVHGIVAQSRGYVTLKSALSAGTTFTVYLPRAHEPPSAHENGVAVTQRGHNETILLVEDEQAVRALARRVLVRAGYRVLESASPRDALRLAAEHAHEIKLVLTDVVMPEMSGPILVSKVAEMCPHARVLYISGYTDDEVIGRGLANPALQLLQKPFSAQQLVERVRGAIDSGQESGSPAT
jgi:signal transduction histidine kinase/ActR/RegA family two-component response regulator